MSKQIDELVSKLKEASNAYYNTGSTVLTDAQYDGLVDQLRELDPDNEYLKTVGAPVSEIGAKVKHKIPMGSQEKLKDKSDFERWAGSIVSLDNSGIPFVMQHKLDGVSIALYYEKGILVSAVGRGDGYIGEDVTENVRKMKNVKERLPVPFSGSLRGEIILTYDLFESFFKPLGYKNPRNSVSGLTRDQKGKDLQKHFIIYYYDLLPDEGSLEDLFNTVELSTGSEYTEVCRLAYINEILKLKTVETEQVADIEAAWSIYKQTEEKRSSIPYELDGMIIRANSLTVQDKLGMSSGLCPKGQRCVKFASQRGTTKVVAVEITIGHTGAIIPTVKVEPIYIGGVTISSILGNNFEYCTKLGLAIGDTVLIERAGDVIPHIVEVVQRGDNRVPVVAPSSCPSCATPLVQDGAATVCRNDACEGRAIRLVKTWITKREIKYIGDELLAELFNNQGIKSPANLYSLTEEKLAVLPRGNGVVGSMAKKIMAELEKSRECPLADFVGSLGIKFLGRRMAEIMINGGVNTLEKFVLLKEDQLSGIPGFVTVLNDEEAENVAVADYGTRAIEIVKGIKKARSLILAMIEAGIKVVEPSEKKEEAVKSGPLSGKSFCFTGAILKTDESGKRLTRQKMWEIVKQNGGQVFEEVKAGCTFLVQADPSSQSSKTKKAEKLGTKIISEADFFNMIG